jgi:hypothetical protein
LRLPVLNKLESSLINKKKTITLQEMKELAGKSKEAYCTLREKVQKDLPKETEKREKRRQNKIQRITLKCNVCGKEKIVKADRELREELAVAQNIVCHKPECSQALPVDVDQGFIRAVHFFGESWGITRKATVEELQSVWRAKQTLHSGRKTK